jgi:AAA15 family ATPase/GTPase
MIIKKLIIRNFRSYYGKKEFEFSNRLNLILGSNGDGKTTFFDAINWVLTPDYVPKDSENQAQEERSMVSAKMFRELAVGDRGRVSVTLELKNNIGQNRVVERGFDVYKLEDDKMRIDNRSHKAFQTTGGVRKEMFSVKDLFEKENVFPAVIKKYHIFKGEDKLNIFNDKATLQALIDMFSEIKDLEPYKAFTTYAQGTAERVLTGAKEKQNKQQAKLNELQRDIVTLSKLLEQAEFDLRRATSDFAEASRKIDAVDRDYAVIQEAAKMEKEVAGLEREIDRLESMLSEEYSTRLLDDQWILLGFAPVLNEFNRKMDSLSLSKANIEDEFRKKQEAELAAERVEKATTELEKIAWGHADVEKMKYMLSVHRCVYCGSDAAEGSARYDFIKQRIQEVVNLLAPRPEAPKPQLQRYFSDHNIEDLKELGLSLSHAGKDLSTIPDDIESAYRRNDEVRALMAKKRDEVNALRRKIDELYAHSSTGENLKEYVSNIAVVNKWHEQKQQSALTMERLQSKTIPDLQEQINKKRDERNKSAKDAGAGSMVLVCDYFRLLRNALERTESSVYEEFLDRLAQTANSFLARLNVDDFTGVIKIYQDRYKSLQIVLQDRNGQVITNPNTSLLTTMHISILFAISELTRESREADYPLIFDAPTSSFDEGKDKTFYECLSNEVNKQCIVVTKSYLYKNSAGEFVTDREALSRLDCQKYRIRKLSGFDKLDLTTIDTMVEEITED